MSEKALRGYKAVNDAQRDLRWARNIRGEIESARGTPHEAGIRWPFELLQNALDAGPRVGRDHVEIHLRQNGAGFTFKHDGAAFSFEELSALVSGGSSKEFDSAETTGRFGTGFLVTHVLATRTRVAGLLDTTDALESFSLVLERSGDEAAIVANMAACTDAIGAATPVDTAAAARMPSAEFEYVTRVADALEVGLAAFRASVPYLFGTCPRLGRVVFEQGDRSVEAWDGPRAISTVRDGMQFDERVLHRTRGDERVAFRVLRAARPGGLAAAVVVLESEDGARWRVAVPARDFPRVFRSYPMALSSFFPVDVILDGLFDVDKSRRWITLKDDDEKARFVESLDAAAALIGVAREQEWMGWHALARAAPSPSSFSMPEDVSQRKWLTNALQTFAHLLARMPFIETRRGYGAALAGDGEGAWHVDFLNPRLSDGSGDNFLPSSAMKSSSPWLAFAR